MNNFAKGKKFLDKSQYEKSLKYFKKSLLENKNDITYYYQGIALRGIKMDRDAILSFENAYKINPLKYEYYNAIGNILIDHNDLEQALPFFKKSIEISPNNIEAYNNIGYILLEKEIDITGSISFFAKVLELDKNPYSLSIANNNIGNALGKLGRLEDALLYFDAAIKLIPNYQRCLHNKGVTLKKLKRYDESIDAFKEALKYEDLADTHLDLALTYLTIGNFKDGWKEYEYRFKTDKGSKLFDPPLYYGDLTDKTVLLYSEQGNGDTLQFIRYVKKIKEKSPKKIIVLIPECLKILFESIPEIDEIIILGISYKDIPDYDFRIPLISLPLLFGTDENNIPNEIPYFKTNKINHFEGNYKIGLCWAGNPRKNDLICNNIDRERSLSLKLLEPLFELPFTYVSLQMENNQINDYPNILNPMKDVKNYDDTAAIINGLDLVITVDTSVAHLAGGLGKKVWLLSRYDGCWRWMNKETTLWYPNMTIFQQPSYGDWGSVILKIKNKLLIEINNL